MFTLLWPHREPTSSVTLDVGDGRGVAGWLSAGADGPLWASTKRSHYWSDYRAVTRHAHGIGEVTLAEPSTGLATWRSAAGRLRIAVKGLGGSWEREAALGEDVEVARLVSDAAGDALLAWSSGGPRPGVYVAARPAG